MNIRFLKRSRRGIVVPLIMLFFLASSCDRSPNDESNKQKSKEYVKIILARSPTQLCILPIIANYNGYFKEENLIVEEKEFFTGKLCFDAMLGGGADFSTVAELPIAIAAFTQEPISIIGTISRSGKSTKILANKKHNINKPRDLIGKKIATSKGTNAEYVLSRFLERNNISKNDVKITYLNPPELVPSISRGDVSAISVWEPFITKAQNSMDDKSIIFLCEDFYTETFNITCLKKYESNNKEVVIKFLRSLRKASDFVKKNPKESKIILTKKISMDINLINTIWDYYDFELVLDTSLATQMRDEAIFAIDEGWVNKGSTIPDYSKLLSTKIFNNLKNKP